MEVEVVEGNAAGQELPDGAVRSYGDIAGDALKAYGFTEPERAARILRSLSGEGVPDALFERLLPQLLTALRASADPDRAVNNFERWAARVGSRFSHFDYLAAHPRAVEALIAVFAGSQYFSNVLINQPEYAEIVTNPAIRSHNKAFAEYYRDASRAVDIFKKAGGKRSALRRFKALEMLRIGARDLLGVADTATITREISDFADAAVQKAFEICSAEECEKRGLAVVPSFAVIAMGKLGARELNYSSDIDLIFVHGDDTGAPVDYFLSLAQSIINTLSEQTGDGFVFRVDMRLRPEGRFGALSRSLGACRAYYESWGETWERQALLKARPIAGDPALGAEFLRLVQPFVFGRGNGSDVVAALRQNKKRIETKMQVSGQWKTSVKEGYGGIRDIEFAVQMLQIVLGGAHPALRSAQSTQVALRRLQEMHVLTEDERQTLETSYWFLRAVEHRLQILNELPVRDLPAKEIERNRLARRMGFPDVAAFDSHYAAVTDRVRILSTRLIGELEGAAGLQEADEWAQLLATAEDPTVQARLKEMLKERHFADPARALRFLMIPSLGTAHGESTPGTRKRFAQIAGSLVTHCSRTVDPDAALLGLESLAEAMPSREALYGAFADGGERLLSRLCLLGAGSPPLMRSLVQHLELLDMLFDDDEMRTPPTPEELCSRVRSRIAAARNEPGQIKALGAFWRRERLRIGARDLWGETADVATTGRELTDLAEAMLEGLLIVAARRAGLESVLPHFAVIGLGKFGGRELNFPSDGDLLYVHRRPEDGADAIKLAETVRDVMEALRTGQAVDMEFDPRLRPDGRYGLLSRTPEGYADYYGREALTWERQTLIRARPVGGDPEVAAAYMAVAHAAVYSAPVTDRQVEEMRAMKRRIESERVRHAELKTDLKLGHGAMADIEWTAQLLQWRHGADYPVLRLPGTRAALDALTAGGFLARDDFLHLAETYDFLARLRDLGYLRTGLPADVLPAANPERLRALARLMGFSDDEGGTAARHLLDEHAARTGAVRATFRHLFGGEKTL